MRVKVHRGVLWLSLFVLVVGLYFILNAPREITWIPPSLTGLQTFEPSVLGVTSISPVNVSQAATLQLDVIGVDFNSSAVLNFSNPNVTVLSLVVVSSTLIQANISVSINATPGLYNVTVNQTTEESALVDGLNITEGPFDPGTLTNVTPIDGYLVFNTSSNSTAPVNLTYNITTAFGVNKTQVNITGGWINLTNLNTSNFTVLNLTNATDPQGTWTVQFAENTFTEEGTYFGEMYLDLLVDGEYVEREYYVYLGVGAEPPLCTAGDIIGAACCLVGAGFPTCPVGFTCGHDFTCEPNDPGGTVIVPPVCAVGVACTISTGVGPVQVCSLNYLGVAGAPCNTAGPNSCSIAAGGPVPPGSCRIPTYAGATFAVAGTGVKTAGAAGGGGGVVSGGGGGGSSRLNEELIITSGEITAGNLKFNLPVKQTPVGPIALDWGDDVVIRGISPLSLTLNGYILQDSKRVRKVRAVTVTIGSHQQTVITDKEGFFTIKYDKIESMWKPSEWSLTMTNWYRPNMQRQVPGSLGPYRRGTTYNQAFFLPNPTFNIDLITGAPGAPLPPSDVEIPGLITGPGQKPISVGLPKNPTVTFNNVPVQSVTISLQPTPEPQKPITISLFQPQPWWTEAGIECTIDCDPATGKFIVSGPPGCTEQYAPGAKIDCGATISAPGPNTHSYENLKKKCCPTSVGCSLSCESNGIDAIFTYNPSPPCPGPFTVNCNSAFSQTATDPPGYSDKMNAELAECCRPEGCGYSCLPSTDGGKTFTLVTTGPSPPCVKADKPVDCTATLTGIPGYEAMKAECCAPRACEYSCEVIDGKTFKLITSGPTPPCVKSDKPISCDDTLTGVPGWEDMKKNCCISYPGGICGRSEHWHCDDVIFGFKALRKHIIFPASPKCKPLDAWGPFVSCQKAIQQGIDPASKQFEECCPAWQPPACARVSIPGPCAFDPICDDQINKQSFRATPDELKQAPFRRWVYEQELGPQPPCPPDTPCAFSLPCDCGDMLQIFGTCDGPLLKMFAGMWNMDAFFTKLICCPECKSGDERSCYTGPVGTKNVGACKEGKETCANNKWGPCQGEVTPNPEVCGDNIDNNCNGAIDEGCPCDNSPPRPCGPQQIGACQQGTQFCVNGIWGNCQGALFPTGELCGDNIDNDCNGQTDETCPSIFPTPVPTQPPSQPPTGFPPRQPPLPPAGPPTVISPGPSPATSTAATSVSSPGLGVTGPALSAVPEMCVYVQGSAKNVGLSPAEFAEGVIPPGYELIDKVQVTNCDGQRVWVTRSISNIWEDVQVLSCKGDDCKTITQQETTEEMKCGDVEVGELFTPQLTNRQQYMEVEQMVSIAGIGKEVTENDPSISTGLYKFQFTARMPGLVELSRPDARVELPANSCIGASGTPIVIKVAKRHSPMPVIITMPVALLQNADPSTYSIYVKSGSEWFELGGKYDSASGTISVTLADLVQFLDKDNKALFLVAGLTCHALKESCVVMHDAGNDEATVLIHGVTSTTDTWWPLVKEATFNGEKYDWIGYAYPPTDTIDKAAAGLKDCLSTLGKYKKVNIVAHSVGGTIALKALDQMYNEKSKYTVINNVDKVITLGMPNQGLDVRALHKFAEFLANHKMLARAFDRDSIILSEITSPDWKPIKNPNPPWVRFIAVAGTEHCDYLDWLFTDTFGEVGKAITVPEEIKQFILANDCLVTVPNAISYLGKPEACRNMFTPYAWHPKLNDRWDMRKLIMYLLNAEKAKADPKRSFDGVNQYVSWQDTCQQGKTYAIVGKRGEQPLPGFCNCGNNVCETNLGEDAINCPSDCKAWAIFLCVMFENISNILLVLFAIVFTIYIVRKYALSKNPPLRAWRLALSIILIAIFIMLVLIWFWCHRLPAVSWLLAIVLTLLFVGETLLGKQSAREPPKVVHGKKAQHSSHSESAEIKVEAKAPPLPPPEPEKYVPDAEESAIDQKISELKKRLKNI